MDPSNRWIIPTVVICLFGFIKELRPVEPFLTPFLVSKNLTENEIESQIYPFWTYSYTLSLIPVFILTDIVRYKPVIIAEGLALVGSGLIMIFGDTVGLMRLMQCLYGVATAADIGYFAYLYAVVPQERYQAVSSYTRSAYLAGGFLSSILSQVFISYQLLSYAGLNIFGTVSVTIATLISFLLPAAKKSLFFHQTFTNEGGDSTMQKGDEYVEATQTDNGETLSNQTLHQIAGDDSSNTARSESESVQDTHAAANGNFELCCTSEPQLSDDCEPNASRAGYLEMFKGLLTEFWCAYRDWNLLQWSIWWSVATCGYFQIGNYVQNLWDLILFGEGGIDEDLYYGAVEALSTLLGAVSTFLIMYVKVNWDIYGELLMGLMSLLDCALIVVMGLTTNIWVAYINYVVFRASYQVLITIASFQIAKFLTVERYALVFGWNTFVALILQSLLTLIVVDSHGLNLPADTQFLIYGGYFGVLGGAFLVKASLVLYRMIRQ